MKLLGLGRGTFLEKGSPPQTPLPPLPRLSTLSTSGNQIAALLMAAEAEADIVDTAVSSMSSLTSQPSMNSLVAALQGQERDTGLSLERLQELTDYWSDVRERYRSFEGARRVRGRACEDGDPSEMLGDPVPERIDVRHVLQPGSS